VKRTSYEAPHYAVSVVSRHFLPLGSKYSQHTVLRHPQSMWSTFHVRDQVSDPYKTICKIMVLYILWCTTSEWSWLWFQGDYKRRIYSLTHQNVVGSHVPLSTNKV